MKKGFTLIELLAVIVILALIAIITTPMIFGMIDSSKKGAFKAHKRAIEEAANNYYVLGYSMGQQGTIKYVTVGQLIDKKLLKGNEKIITSGEINNDSKIIIYNGDNGYNSSLQIYEDYFMEWYKNEMINGTQALVKKDKTKLPISGETTKIDVNLLMDEKYVDELRLSNNLESRCQGYTEIFNHNDKYEYKGYLDCGENSSIITSSSVTFGGKYNDGFRNVIETKDKGYVAVGYSQSPAITTYGTTTKGYNDGIIVKYESDGTVQWVQTFGGSSHDSFYDVIETAEGDYIVVGTTASQDGDLESLYTDRAAGAGDALIVKYSNTGQLLEKKVFGGGSDVGDDCFLRISSNPDGTYVVVGEGYAHQKDFDYTNVQKAYGYMDDVIVVYDSNLNILSSKVYGGGGNDYLNQMIKDSEGNYVILGASNSTNQDYAGVESYGSVDALIMKCNSDFNIMTIKKFGGSASDKFVDGIEVSDGYIILGYSPSTDGLMTGISKGEGDVVLVKYSKDLSTIIWKKTIGGSKIDNARRIINTKDGFTVIGSTYSNDGDIIGKTTTDDADAFIMQFDYQGNLKKNKIYGGTYNDVFDDIIETNNSYVLVGSTYSNDGDIAGQNKGSSDALLALFTKDLNSLANLKERVVLVEKVKEMSLTDTEKYGVELKDNYEHIYTTIDPTQELKSWCSSGNFFGTFNYKYGSCLYPMNEIHKTIITRLNVNNSISGINTLSTSEIKNEKNWQFLSMSFHSNYETILSEFKIDFQDGNTYSIEEAVAKHYIQPLVILSQGPYSDQNRTISDLLNIKSSNGNVNLNGGIFQMAIKPIKKIKNYNFRLNKKLISYSEIILYELNQFDLSITPVSN